MNILKRTATDILTDICSFYGISKDRDLADKLGVSAVTVSNWKRRNTYDINIIVARCPDVNINDLLRGSSLKFTPGEATPAQFEQQAPQSILNILKDKDQVIIELAKENGSLKEQLKRIKKERDVLAHKNV